MDYYFDLSTEAQYHSYEVMNREVSFLFTSILMDDCVGRGKAFFQMGKAAQVAADAIQHKGPPSAAFAAVQAVRLQNQDRKFYANCANPVCLA